MKKRLSQSGRLRTDAEAQAARAPTAAASKHTRAALVHELRVHQIELEVQNDELRQVQMALESARDRYIDLYDFAPVGYFTLSSSGLITEANLTCATMLAEERARLVGSHFAHHVALADRDRWHRYALALVQHGEPGQIEVLILGQDGRSFHAQLDGRYVAVPDAPPTLRVALTDITERKRAEAELRIAAVAFEAQEGIMITDASGVIERVNKAFTQITGYSAVEAVGRTSALLHSGRHDSAFYKVMWDTLLSTGAWQGEVWNRRKNGQVYPEWLTITAVCDDELQVTRYVGMMQDISQRKAREAEIERLAFYDPLTGLPNRRLMNDRLQQAMAVSARSRREGALMFIDLDNFKKVNDTLGHDKGDLLIQQVAQRLTTCVREYDTVARQSGDEFIIVLAADLSETPTLASAQAMAVGEKVLAALRRPYVIDDQEYQCSASIGVTLFSNHTLAADELLKRADQAMYQAKAGGRNALRFFDTAVQGALHQR